MEKSERKQSALELASTFEAMVEAIKPELCMELGAMRAEFSQRMRERLPSAYIVAFEANPYNFEDVAPSLEGSGVDYRFSAVGDTVGKATMKINRRRRGKPVGPRRGSNSLLVSDWAEGDFFEVEVPVTTVDNVTSSFSELPTCIAMWIDVEGFAFQVISGARQSLARTGLLMIELEDSPIWQGQKLAPEVTALLAECGFTPAARDFENGGQYNVIFARADVLQRPEIMVLLSQLPARSRLV